MFNLGNMQLCGIPAVLLWYLGVLQLLVMGAVQLYQIPRTTENMA